MTKAISPRRLVTALLVATCCVSSISHLIAQNPVTQVEGFLEVYLPSDTTSMYIGLNAGNRLFPIGNSNTFVGTGVGSANGGSFNSFFGYNTGTENTGGDSNSFFGYNAGTENSEGNSNSFYGNEAGESNRSGDANSFFGNQAGASNTTGNSNSIYGSEAGELNTTGESNSFFGSIAGIFNTTGSYNSFFGAFAGFNNTEGNSNSFFGQNSGSKITTQSKMIIIGSNAGPATPAPTDSMQLYIDVEETDTPLIFGNFEKDELTIYGKQLEISDDITPTLRFDRSGTSNGTQRFDFEITMDGGDMIFQGGRDGSGLSLDTIMRIKADGKINGKVIEISDDDSPLLRFDRSGVKFDFEIAMDGPDMIFQGGRSGTGADLDTLVRIDDDGNITAIGAINGSSDINRKESIVSVDSKSLLEKVANLPISSWQYKGSKDRHIGPMAQDFYAAFGLGQGERTIATVDADGVALAAIQALAQKNEKLENRVMDQNVEIANLKERLAHLEALILEK